jgi:Rps23 Pro-64 3,4-dihydroxylase Tpa1-like proline 4-hydroxylase
MDIINRKVLADFIFDKMNPQKSILKNQFETSNVAIKHFFIDDLLPEDVVLKIHKAFPKPSEMVLKKSLREDKYVAAQMNLYDPILEEIIYAFQDDRIVKLVEQICDLMSLIPDENLYAGGISLMGKNQFLNPHLDNSHDKDRKQWRVLNLLYYVTPNWKIENGGNLELWPNGLDEKQVTIQSKCNRLAVMVTHNQSLHSVSPVVVNDFRSCVSNYYFSENPVFESDTFHVTSFRGRPENRFTDLILQMDTFSRMMVRKFFKKGIKENPHVYKK